MVEGAKSKWEKDLEIGEAFENKVLELFSKKHTAYKIVGKFKAFDLVCECCGTTIECKYDTIANKTGNFFFSFPLLETEADLLFQGTPTSIHWCDMEDLRYWVGLGAELELIQEKVGNEGEYGYVVPINDTQAYMRRMYG
jgi:hypothetical protein